MWIFLQVQTEEDDFETDFYKDLIPLEKNENQQTSHWGEQQSTFHVPIFYSSKKSQSNSHNSAFKQAIQASHKKVMKMVLNLFLFFCFLTFQPMGALFQPDFLN